MSRSVEKITISIETLSVKDEPKEEEVEDEAGGGYKADETCACTHEVWAFYCERCKVIHKLGKFDHILHNKYCHGCHKLATDTRKKAILNMLVDSKQKYLKFGEGKKPYYCPECVATHQPGYSMFMKHYQHSGKK